MFGSIRQRCATLLDAMSLKQQIAIFSAGLNGVLVLLAVLGASKMAENQALRDAHERARAVATSMAQRLDQEMFERYRQIREFADLDAFRPLWRSEPAVLEKALNRLQQAVPIYAWLGFAEPDGTVRAATRGLLRGQSIAARPWFIHGLQGAAVEDVHEAVRLQELLQAGSKGAPFRFVDISMPVRADNATIGVLGAHLSWTWADDARKTVLERQDPDHPMEITVLSSNGAILLGAHDDVAMSRENITELAKQDVRGFTLRSGEREMLGSMVMTKGLAEYPGLGWAVMAREPLDLAMAPARRVALLIFALGTAIALLGGFIAWKVAENVARPISALRGELDLVWREPERVNVSRQHGSTDILALSTSVRSLLRRVSVAESRSDEANFRADLAAIETDQFRKVAEELAEIDKQRSQQHSADIEKLQELADIDSMTGVLNRRAFLPVAQDTFALSQRYGRAFALLVVDIDHFKSINDRHGHLAGDEVIREVADCMRRHIRSTDKLARFGGEEFVVLLREVEQEGAGLLAERMREAVEATMVRTEFHTLRATVSIGIAVVDQGDRDIQDVIERADAALYAAKRSGRNRISVSSSRVPDLLQQAS